MKQYELTLIVDPVLSGDELKATAQTYIDYITTNGGTIVNVDEMGLRPLAYPINKRASGTYYCIEFTTDGKTNFLPKMELTIRRDDRLMRYLTIVLDKFGVKYNEDRRAGKIGSSKKEKAPKGKKAGDAVAPAPAVEEVKAAAAVAAPAAVEEVKVAVAAAAPIDPDVEAVLAGDESPVVVETPTAE
jgi:small subunit ribosomal protein S6